MSTTTNVGTNNTTGKTTTVETAPLWRRFAALVYDSLILLAISMAYGAIVTMVGVKVSPVEEQNYEPMFANGGAGELVLIGWILSLAAFYITFWFRSGQTTGMKAWRLQLVKADSPNEQPTLIRCAQRAAWGVFSLVLLGGGYWYRFISPTGQCLHDKLTQTQVVVLPKGM